MTKQSISSTGLLRRYTPRNDMCFCPCEKIFDFRGNPETCHCERSEAIQPMSLRTNEMSVAIHCLTGLLRRYTPRNDMCFCPCEKIFDFRGNPETCHCERMK